MSELIHVNPYEVMKTFRITNDDITASTNDVVEDFCRQVLATSMSIHAKDCLSEQEKFAICVAAGVPIDSRFDGEDGKLTLTTRYPCGVEKIDGRWTVFTNENL